MAAISAERALVPQLAPFNAMRERSCEQETHLLAQNSPLSPFEALPPL